MNCRTMMPRKRENLSLFSPIFIIAIIIFAFCGCTGDRTVEPLSDNGTIAKKPVDPPIDDDAGSYMLEAKYDSLNSYAGGGGVFVLRMNPGIDFFGDIDLSLTADRNLKAALDIELLDLDNRIFEVTVKPSKQITPGVYTIQVTALHAGVEQYLTLTVVIINIGDPSPAGATAKAEEFFDWLEANHPELGTFSDRSWFTYGTYPGILIVEHWTKLDEEWEFRFCFHVMIPPYDWSKMMLRRRGEWDAQLAAVREYDSTTATYIIQEMPVEDYPIIGY